MFSKSLFKMSFAVLRFCTLFWKREHSSSFGVLPCFRTVFVLDRLQNHLKQFCCDIGASVFPSRKKITTFILLFKLFEED